ncbi:MAG: TfoX/Sxy family protein [Acidimicrobiia bacterium]|nr:TfoX/Sxy family protein [Acidimicrobiia bacterium]
MAERLVDDFAHLGNVTTKKMFGGFGVFEDGVMFAIVDSAGAAFLRADESSSQVFEDAGSERHSRMPYWLIPGAVLDDPKQLAEWAETARDVAKAAKKK